MKRPDMSKATKKVFKNIYDNVATRKNSDYEKIAKSFKNYPRSLDYSTQLIVPYVEDVVEDIESKDETVSFTDTDIVEIANDVAEMIGDRMTQSGQIASMKKMRESAMDETEIAGQVQLDEGCGCSKGESDADFEYAMKRKKNMVESLLSKVRLSGDMNEGKIKHR